MKTTVSQKISVVIPTYNGAQFIREAIESVFKQTLLPQEIVVVDDASRDETSSIVTSMVPTAPLPLRLIQLKTNSGGPALPLNIGIRETSGEFIAVLDQDDLFLRDKLEKQIGLLVSHPQLVFAFSCCGNYNKPNQMLQSRLVIQKLLAIGKKIGEGRYQIRGKDILHLFMTKQRNYIFGYPGFVFRRKHWERKGGLGEDLRIGSDYEFLCWLSLQGPVGFIPEISYLRRKHEMNFSDQLAWAIPIELKQIRAQYLPQERALNSFSFIQSSLGILNRIRHHSLISRFLERTLDSK